MPEPRKETPPDGVVSRRLAGGDDDHLIREEPLVIDVSGQQVMTMRTPGDDENLATGFLLSEGVVDDPASITDLRLEPGSAGELRADTIHMHVAVGPERLQGRLTRTHEIRSSCGLCGLANPDELLEELPPLLPGVPRLPRARVHELAERLSALQAHFEATGSCHGAALFGPDGALWSHGEDVGRHNALDKAIGAAARAGHDLGHGTAILSGRAGFDLVLKCLRVRLPVVLSVSGPSALSFDLCVAAGATLVGFVRPGRMVVYSDAGRLC